jgi:hypothetical protein
VGDVEAVQPSIPSYAEVNRQLAERSALAQDQANTANRAARAAASTEVHEVDSVAVERRNWALQQARETGVAQRIGGEPRLLAWLNPDGTTNLRADPANPNKTVATVVHSDQPLVVGECRIITDEEEEALRRRQREAENALLAAHYDVGELVVAGILSAAEAQASGVQAAAAARPKPGPFAAPYSLERSVR